MRTAGATTPFGTRRAIRARGWRGAAVVALSAALFTGASGFAVATPAPAHSMPLFTLTAMPAGWQSRTDLHPALQIQTGGEAIKYADDGSQINGTIPADVLGAATTEVRNLAAADMGVPEQNDKGMSIIDFMPSPPDQDVHLVVYGPEVTDKLTDDQKASRKRFDDLFQRLLNAFTPA